MQIHTENDEIIFHLLTTKSLIDFFPLGAIKWVIMYLTLLITHFTFGFRKNIIDECFLVFYTEIIWRRFTYY